jgi:hypothetical protein
MGLETGLILRTHGGGGLDMDGRDERIAKLPK